MNFRMATHLAGSQSLCEGLPILPRMQTIRLITVAKSFRPDIDYHVHLTTMTHVCHSIWADKKTTVAGGKLRKFCHPLPKMIYYRYCGNQGLLRTEITEFLTIITLFLSFLHLRNAGPKVWAKSSILPFHFLVYFSTGCLSVAHYWQCVISDSDQSLLCN